MSFKDEIKDLIPGPTDLLEDAVQAVADTIMARVKEVSLSWQHAEQLTCTFLVSPFYNIYPSPDKMWLQTKPFIPSGGFWKRLSSPEDMVLYSQTTDYANRFYQKLSYKLSNENGFSLDGWCLFSVRDFDFPEHHGVRYAGGSMIYPADLEYISIFPSIDPTKPFSVGHQYGHYVLQQDSFTHNTSSGIEMGIRLSFKM